MIDKLLNQQLLKLVSNIIGSLLLAAGAGLIIFHKKLDFEYPHYLYAGIAIMCVGFIVWLVSTILSYNLKIKGVQNNETQNEIKKIK